MAEEKSMLMRLCTEDVYSDNIFHLLGLQTTATLRDIRRRREDLESAHDMGEGTWKREFRHLLGNRVVPTFEEVKAAFEHLADPEYRIVSEFFWMWPLDKDDAALNELVNGKRSAAIKIWEQAAVGFGKKRSIAQHNLAVLYQFYAIDAELQAIDAEDVPDDFHRQMCGYWEKSFGYWEDLADSDDFWKIFEARMREFDDPRLTGDYTSILRKQFPVAFDNINARLAAEYAKRDKFADAKRHVDYMLKTMSGLDDVEETLRILFEPMERRVDLLITKFDEAAKEDGRVARKCVDDLMSETKEIRRIALGLLAEGQRLRTKIFSEIVSACNRYQVSYGNATKDWKGCDGILEKLKAMEMPDELRGLIEDNARIIKQNIKDEEALRTCWCCKKKMDAFHSFTVPMYGNVYADANGREIQAAQRVFVSLRLQGGRGYGYLSPEEIIARGCPRLGCTRFETMQIKVPCCPECAANLTWGKVKDYPPIAKLVQRGFKLGNKPDDYEAMKAWGVSEWLPNLYPHHVSDNEKADGSRGCVYTGEGSGCLDVLVLMALFAALAGCAVALH